MSRGSVANQSIPFVISSENTKQNSMRVLQMRTIEYTFPFLPKENRKSEENPKIVFSLYILHNYYISIFLPTEKKLYCGKVTVFPQLVLNFCLRLTEFCCVLYFNSALNGTV